MENSNDKAKFLGKITASVTHEIQNVLAIIKETSGLMEDFLQMNKTNGLPDLDERIGKCLETIKRQAYRGVGLTSGLNGFAHTPDSTQTSIGVFETVKKMLFVADRLFKQKGVDVTIIECDKPYSIITDPVLFQMVLFECIECLIYNFQITTLALDIQSLKNLTAIKFSISENSFKYEGWQQKITQSIQWTKITEICDQINLKAEVSKDTPGILISFT